MAEVAVLPARITAFDRAKGIAIILIVALHVGPGLIVTGLMPDNAAMRFAEAWAYSFHVQVLFVIGGFLAWPRLYGWRFHVDRFAALYYPYLVWSVLSVTLAIVLPGANHALGWGALLWLPVMPQLHFWFVPALLATTLVAGLIGRNDWLLVGLGVAGLAVSPYDFNWVQAGTYLPYLCLGVIMARHRWLPATPAPLAWLSAIGSIGAAWLALRHGWTFKDAVFFPIGLCGCYAVLALARAVDRGGAAVVLDYLGRKSLAIYLAHGLFATAARIVWLRVFGAHAPWVAFVVCSAVGICGPVVLDELAGRIGLAEAIGLRPLRIGRWSRRTADLPRPA